MKNKKIFIIVFSSIFVIIFVAALLFIINKFNNYEIKDKYTTLDDIPHLTFSELVEFKEKAIIVTTYSETINEEVENKIIEYANYSEKHANTLSIYICSINLGIDAEDTITLYINEETGFDSLETSEEIIIYLDEIMNKNA